VQQHVFDQAVLHNSDAAQHRSQTDVFCNAIVCLHRHSPGICLQVLYRLYCKRKLRATLGVHHPPAQASSTLPSNPLELDSAKLDAETLSDAHKGEEHQQKEVADTVDATSKLVRLQAVCITSRAVLCFDV